MESSGQTGDRPTVSWESARPISPSEGSRAELGWLRRQFSSLRSTFKAMVLIGLFMGAVFPFYSSLFFGGAAFSPLYVGGCLAAGFLVGTLCYSIVKQVLRLHVETQWETLRRFPGAAGCISDVGRGGDELETLVRCRDSLIARLLTLVESVTSLTRAIHPHYERLADGARSMVGQNERQISEVRKSVGAADGMKGAFAVILREVEAMAARSEERASISLQMSRSATDIASGMEEHAGLVLATSDSIEQIAASLRRSRADIEELSASTGQTSAAITQVATAIADVRDFAQRTTDFSASVQFDAHEGMQAMRVTLKTMGGIEATAEQSCDAIERLSVHTAQVGGILATIQDVAQQTNLLSLNASIIAAKAGERGRAFNVVAEEVRRLAQRTAVSAKEIAELVQNIQTETQAVQGAVNQVRERVGAGVEVSRNANRALETIERGAREASGRVRRIAEDIVGQAAGSRLIREEAMKNLERLQRVTSAIQDQERASSAVASTLAGLRTVSRTMAASVEQMAAGNRQYLQGAVADRDRTQALQGTAREQFAAGEGVVASVRETGRLIEANATKAALIVQDIETVTELTAALLQEVATLSVEEEKVSVEEGSRS